MSRRITIIGAGVIGLSIAHEFADAGDDVTVVADQDTMNTVSAVSAALWFPFHTEKSALADQLLSRSLTRFNALATLSETGVQLRTGVVIERHHGPDRAWTHALPDTAEILAADLPAGALSGLRVIAPFIEIPRYLPWLQAQNLQKGVAFERRAIGALDELASSSDMIVIAGGIRGGELLGGDPEITPVRGQVVRLANPGIQQWIVDEGNPAGLSYVFPREYDVLVGGTAVEGDWDESMRAEVQSAMLDRAYELVPALKGQAVLGSAVGLRPARSSIRLQRIESHAVPVITAYGHGGAGVTLSWGTAEHVVQLSR